MPETFIVNKNNIVLYRQAGPITEEIYDNFYQQIKESNKITSNKNLQQFIIDKKHESLSIDNQGLQLGMTEKKVAMILGEPKHKDQHIENNLQFEMWTYPKNADISFLYFQNKMLTRIEK